MRSSAALIERVEHPTALNEEQRAMVTKHRGLVISIARKFAIGKSIPEDFIQQGHLGLCLAAIRFDASRGFTFLTYAQYWVRAMLYEHVLFTSGPVKLGNARRMRKVFFGLSKARRFVEKECGGEASIAAIAKRLGVDEDLVQDMQTRREVPNLSLDFEYENGQRFDLKDGRPDQEELFAVAEEDCFAKRRLAHAMRLLNEQERAVIHARHLDNDDADITLQSIGDKWGLSRERIRQIEVQAFKKMRKAMGIIES